ncbi:hypothetical protein FHS31_001883 [Sphingomonas vulcanisoli]|uniref:DUF721 domain-containing protein n=1 Tax=Sphingomonas vulcanisoli TaxID=1658060 RepID=A0ABX0TRW6_9SPHN|nr:hypothetical protein [Sphingomonas vulcanisoli]
MTERKSRAPSKAKPGDAPRAMGTRSVSEMLPTIGGTAFRKFGFVQSAVVSRWAEIVGPRYAGVSHPESIRFPGGKRSDGVLNLTVEGAHATMMQHVAPTIVERVNMFFGYPAVARIAIRQTAVTKPAPRRAPPSLKTIPAALGDSLRTIADPELHACLSNLAAALGASEGLPKIGDGDRRRSND